jgi:hypothetical protein
LVGIESPTYEGIDDAFPDPRILALGDWATLDCVRNSVEREMLKDIFFCFLHNFSEFGHEILKIFPLR